MTQCQRGNHDTNRQNPNAEMRRRRICTATLPLLRGAGFTMDTLQTDTVTDYLSVGVAGGRHDGGGSTAAFIANAAAIVDL